MRTLDRYRQTRRKGTRENLTEETTPDISPAFRDHDSREVGLGSWLRPRTLIREEVSVSLGPIRATNLPALSGIAISRRSGNATLSPSKIEDALGSLLFRDEVQSCSVTKRLGTWMLVGGMVSWVDEKPQRSVLWYTLSTYESPLWVISYPTQGVLIRIHTEPT